MLGKFRPLAVCIRYEIGNVLFALCNHARVLMMSPAPLAHQETCHLGAQLGWHEDSIP